MTASSYSWLVWADDIDKRLSRFVFHCVLPPFVEVLLTAPGAWFGCPPYAGAVVPLVTALAVPQAPGPRLGMASLVMMCTGLWFKCCRDSCRNGYGIVRAYIGLGVGGTLAASHISMAIISLGNPAGMEVAALYTTSWNITQLMINALKNWAWRPRPGVQLAEELDTVPRTVREIGSLVRRDTEKNLSFPSGDAAGSAIFASSLALVVPPLAAPAAAVAALSSFGRVYFHCHHLLDVVVGSICGVLVTAAISRSQTSLGWRHMLLSQLLLLGLYKPTQWFRPKQP